MEGYEYEWIPSTLSDLGGMPLQQPASPARLCLLLLGLGDLELGEVEFRWVGAVRRAPARRWIVREAKGAVVLALAWPLCVQATDNAGPPSLVTREISRPKHYTY